MKVYLRAILFFLIITLSGCSVNDSDSTDESGDDSCDTCRGTPTVSYESIAERLYSVWYVVTYGYSSHKGSPVHMLATAADNVTMSWTNVGMQDASTEPRIAWNNSPEYEYEYVTNQFFNNMYSVLSSANDILLAIDVGTDFGENSSQLETWSKFIQAISLANIALTFDQGFIITEDTPENEVANPVLYSSVEIQTKALSLFDEAILMARENNFILPDEYMNGVDVDNVLLSELASTYAARLMAYMPRNENENRLVDWERAREYARNGIKEDFSLLMDDIDWINDLKWTSAYPDWGRTDMRIIHMMYQEEYPAYNEFGLDFGAPDPAIVSETSTIDNRLILDFDHVETNNFKPDRGLYHFSSFRHSRYDDYYENWTGYIPELLVEENRLIYVEAELELGNLTLAAEILNSGYMARKNRGGLPDVPVSESAIREVISYERQIELIGTSFGIQFFDMRKQDLLQYGTFLELPLPGKIQELLQYDFPYYTFGGENPSSSQGGWR